MTQEWDAIVVGAGQGGLTCAAYLAVAGGLRVLVLERNAIAGGSSQVFRRRGRYEFDVGTHYIGDCGPGGVIRSIYEGLGLGGRIEFRPLEPDGFDHVVLPTVSLRVPHGWAAYRERLVAALPAEADAVRDFVDASAAAHGYMRSTMLGDGESGTQLSAHRSLARWTTATLGQLMRACGLSTRARTVLAAQCGNYGMAPDDVSAAAHTAMIGEFLMGAYYPVGGGQMLAATLMEALQANRSEVRTRAEVAEIVVANGRVAGVRTVAGEVLHAPIVVSNADYRRTMADLLAPEHLPPAVVARAGRMSMALPLVTLYLAVGPGAPAPPANNIWWYDTDDIDGMFAELAGGEFSRPQFAFISSGTAKGGPRGASRGAAHHTLEIMTLCPSRHAPWLADGADAAEYGYRNHPRYVAEKARVAEALMSMAERAVGPLRDHVVYSEVATPSTHTRFTMATDGTPYGIGASPAQFGRMRPDHRTSLPGLYLVGTNTRSGYGIGGVTMGGVRCAGLILDRPLLPDVCAGKMFGSGAELADRPPDWDPLHASRGSRQRRTELG
jgi:phytoene dehydrogenase-like protein